METIIPVGIQELASFHFGKEAHGPEEETGSGKILEILTFSFPKNIKGSKKGAITWP